MTGAWKGAILIPTSLDCAADLQLRYQALTEPGLALSFVQQHLLAMVSAAMRSRSFCSVKAGVECFCVQEVLSQDSVGMIQGIEQTVRQA